METGEAEDRPGAADGVFILIAAFNEERAIGDVVSEVVRTHPAVVVVDDGSTDRTCEIAAGAGAAVLRHVVNRGQGAALQTGLTYCLEKGARIIVTYDADGQHSPEDIPAVIAPILAGQAQVVLGSRFLGGHKSIPQGRKMLLKAGIVFTRLTSGIRLTDVHNGFRAFSREAAEHINIRLDRMAHASEIIDQIRRSGLPCVEVPVNIRYTEYSMAKGQSSANAVKVAADYLVDKILK